jgi:hypothetical protein
VRIADIAVIARHRRHRNATKPLFHQAFTSFDIASADVGDVGDDAMSAIPFR